MSTTKKSTKNKKPKKPAKKKRLKSFPESLNADEAFRAFMKVWAKEIDSHLGFDIYYLNKARKIPYKL